MSHFRDSFSAEEWRQQELIDSQVTNAVFGADVSPLPEPIESTTMLSEASIEMREPSPHNLPPKKLSLLRLADWDPQKTYDEDPPDCIRYDLAWKVAIKGTRGVHKDMDENQVLEPSLYWELFLKPKVKEYVLREGPATKDAENTKVVVSISQRAVLPFTKPFNNTDINWSIIEKKLVDWGNLFPRKKLRLDLSFNFTLDSPRSLGSSSNSTGRRGRLSATQRMLSERAEQLDADTDDLGRPPAYDYVYRLFRCPGPPCELALYCWVDSMGKHHPLKREHIARLITHYEQRLPLRTQADIPDDLKGQLRAEARQRLDRKQKNTASSPSDIRSIQITNVLPGQSQQTPLATAHLETVSSSPTPDSIRVKPLSIPGPRDVARARYCAWQEAQVENEEDKEHYRMALDIAQKEGLDLEQIYEDGNHEIFSQKGVKIGISRRFVRASDIKPGPDVIDRSAWKARVSKRNNWTEVVHFPMG